MLTVLKFDIKLNLESKYIGEGIKKKCKLKFHLTEYLQAIHFCEFCKAIH